MACLASSSPVADPVPDGPEAIERFAVLRAAFLANPATGDRRAELSSLELQLRGSGECSDAAHQPLDDPDLKTAGAHDLPIERSPDRQHPTGSELELQAT